VPPLRGNGRRGERRAQRMKTCPKCSAEAYDEEAICRQCGSKLPKVEAVTSADSTTEVEAAVIVPRKPSLTATQKVIVGLMGVVGVLCTISLVSYYQPHPVDSSLPKHTVASDSLLVNGRRIEIHVSNTDLSRADCMALVGAYRDRAQSSGQVSIYQPDRQGVLKIWCVDNLDGQGVVFNDALFTPTHPEATTRAPVIIYSTIEPARRSTLPAVFTPRSAPRQVCCKVCSKGKACGDSCISKDKTCNKGPGCACNG
jgi:hypothetical protein